MKTTETISHAQYCELIAAIERASAGMPEGRAMGFRFELKEQLLRELHVPKCDRYVGHLRFPNLEAIRAADLERALQTIERLALLPA